MLPAYASRPTVAASNITYNNLNCGSFKINWTSGNGVSRLIVGREGGLPTYTPTDGLVYSADPIFGNSTEYSSTGDGNFIVYNAGGTNFVTVTNLKPGTSYCFAIYEHDNNGNSTEYLTTGAPTICITTYDIRLDFTFKVNDSCEKSNEFEFTNTSTSTIPGLTYKWDFDGVSANTSPITHAFVGSGYKDAKILPVTSITGCPKSFSRIMKIFPKKVAKIDYTLYEDTQCLEDNYFEIQAQGILGPFPLGTIYKWWFGDGDSSTFPRMKKRYKTSGTFQVQLELTSTSYSKVTACKDTIFFDVTVLPSPVGNMTINDTFQCLKQNGFNFDNPDNTLTYYKWYFGDNDSSDKQSVSHVYNDTGQYRVMHVAYANTGCKGRDTVDVTVLPNLKSNFVGLDTFYCQNNDNVIIIPETDGGRYLGYPVNANVLVPNTIGTHILTYIVEDTYCSDTSQFGFRIAETPNPNIGKDTTICSALSFTLTDINGANSTHFWNTTETSQSIVVSKSGKYFVTASIDKCSATDSVNIDFSTIPKINLGTDTILCKGGGLWLHAFYPKSTYLWSNGSKDSSVYAFNPGKYTVTVTNPCGTVKDSIFVFYQSDYCDLFMANAFSPGNDLVNNAFYPRGRNITVNLFQIYNRWGELVFETDQNEVGWDGTYKGELVQEGLYIWKLFYSTPNGPYIKKSNAFGQVLLIR
jgi:gliding motility-associated-like protein